jgi:hypothetical protein
MGSATAQQNKKKTPHHVRHAQSRAAPCKKRHQQPPKPPTATQHKQAVQATRTKQLVHPCARTGSCVHSTAQHSTAHTDICQECCMSSVTARRNAQTAPAHANSATAFQTTSQMLTLHPWAPCTPRSCALTKLPFAPCCAVHAACPFATPPTPYSRQQHAPGRTNSTPPTRASTACIMAFQTSRMS